MVKLRAMPKTEPLAAARPLEDAPAPRATPPATQTGGSPGPVPYVAGTPYPAGTVLQIRTVTGAVDLYTVQPSDFDYIDPQGYAKEHAKVEGFNQAEGKRLRDVSFSDVIGPTSASDALDGPILYQDPIAPGHPSTTAEILWTAKQSNDVLLRNIKADAQAAGVPVLIEDARKSSYSEDHGG